MCATENLIVKEMYHPGAVASRRRPLVSRMDKDDVVQKLRAVLHE